MEAAYSKCSKPAVYDELHRGLQPFVLWHVIESIEEAYTPEAIGELQEHAEVEALVLERRSIARDRALGYFVSLLHHYLARWSDPADADVDQAVNALLADLDKEQLTASYIDFQLDTTDIYAYVEEQKQNAGLIANESEWNHNPRVSAKLQWNVVFKEALEITRKTYVEACERFENCFVVGAQADLALVQLLSDTELARLASQTRAKPRHIPAPPTGLGTIGEDATQGYWSKRIGNSNTPATKFLPDFDPKHLIRTGQQFRAACIDHVTKHREAATARVSESGKDVDVILSQALNPETNPEPLLAHARQQWTPQSTAKAGSADEEASIRGTKELLSSALRILGQRDGERNLGLRIDAYNLRGHINHRLAALRPQHRANYLGRAIADWSASSELDATQNDIIDLLAQSEIDLEAFSKATPTNRDKEPSSKDVAEAKQSVPSTTTQATIQSQSAADPPEGKKKKQKKASNKTAKATASSSSVPVKSPGNAKEASSNTTDSAVSPCTKTREKTILESPFFRSDLVTGLMVDSLLALAFPHRALRDTLRLPPAAVLAGASQDHVPMLDRQAKSHQQTAKALTPENKAQLTTAIKAVSAVLALPDVQQLTPTRGDSSAKLLRATSLRLVLGTLHLLLNNFVKAQTELELVSNALKPTTRALRSRVHVEQKQTFDSTQAPAASAHSVHGQAEERAIARMQTRVQGQTLFLLANTCWMANKVQEALKFFRWFVTWYSQQQAERVRQRKDDAEEEEVNQSGVGGGQQGAGDQAAAIEIEQVDMGWWDKVVVVTKV